MGPISRLGFRTDTAGVRHPAVTALSTARRHRVSVVVTCFNYGHWLEACVDSALGQAAVDVDVVIVDDASTDDSADVARRIVARGEGRVRLVAQPTNRGHIASINAGLALAEGTYLVKLDADDLLPEGCLERAVALLEACPEVGFAYGRPMHFGRDVDASLTRLQKWARRSSYRKTDRPADRPIDGVVRGWTVWPGRCWMRAICTGARNCISQPEVVMRASVLRSVGPFDAKLSHTHDFAMWLRLAARADVGHVDGAIQGLYRVHPGSLQRTVNAGKLHDLQGRLDAFESILDAGEARHESDPVLLAMARAALADEALEEACRAFDRGRSDTISVDDYIAFAVRACAQVRSRPFWHALRARRRIGTRWSAWFPPFVFQAALRPARDALRTAHWWRHGT